jgi:hypothetical protein
MQSRPHTVRIFVQHGACLRRANHALSCRSPVGSAAMRWASQQSGACVRSTYHDWMAILPLRSSRGIGPGPPRVVIALRVFSARRWFVGMHYWPGRPGLSGEVCNAMARLDSLECLCYWDLDNLVVSDRGIYTS